VISPQQDEAGEPTGRLAAGRRYSVGLMQITSTNFRHYGVTASDLLNPASICRYLSAFSPTVTAAAVPEERSVVTTPATLKPASDRNPPLTRPATYSALAMRPSTREDRQRPLTEKLMPEIRYPAVMRGEPADNATPVLTSLHYPDAVIRGAIPVIPDEENDDA
jgi:type IV secretion system protein VirB1